MRVCPCAHEEPARRLEREVALECGEALVLRRQCVICACVERRALCGVGGIERHQAVDVVRGGLEVVVRCYILACLVVGPELNSNAYVEQSTRAAVSGTTYVTLRELSEKNVPSSSQSPEDKQLVSNVEPRRLLGRTRDKRHVCDLSLLDEQLCILFQEHPVNSRPPRQLHRLQTPNINTSHTNDARNIFQPTW